MHTMRSRSELVCRLRRIASGRRLAGSCAVVCLLAIAVCSVFGCREGGTTLSAEARSPDGRWVASAFSKQYGGPGTAGLYTDVYLKRTDVRQAPIEVLDFSVGELASQSGILNLTMTWQSPSRLDVTYNGRAASLYFQVVKCAGIDIVTRDVSDRVSNQLR
jgi:hypothetical protein